MQKDGRWLPVTESALTASETQLVVNESSGQSNRAAHVLAGRPLDYAWSVRVPGGRPARRRFRVNATASRKGVYVVMRVLPAALPRLEDLEDLDPGLRSALFPASGLVLVSGVMGSGKSTLLAAILHEALGPRGPGRQILTLEDPVEVDFSGIPASLRKAPVTQSAVGLDLPDWPSAVRTLTRRKGEIVMVGECRDRETLSALLSAAEQGMTVYTTVHAPDAAQTVTRIIDAFPEEERAGAAAALLANLRVLIHQRLVPARRSREEIRRGASLRLALREHLVLTEPLRRLLSSLPGKDLARKLGELVETRGLSLPADARKKHSEGRISDETLALVEEERGLSRGRF